MSAIAEFDPAQKGFIVTFTIEKASSIASARSIFAPTSATSMPNALRPKLRMSPGGVYNADAVEKTVEDMTIEVAQRGYPFAAVRPRGDRNFQSPHRRSCVSDRRRSARLYRAHQYPRQYAHARLRHPARIRYRRRRRLQPRAGRSRRAAAEEPQLSSRSVKITNEPGSAPDRIIVNVDVEEQSTGEFSFSGGYSTADGLLGEVSVGERNLLGRGQSVRAAVQYGTRARGFDLSFVEPYFLGYRLALGLDVFASADN